uniref:PGG domain-containing protein n=1 Tax=Aegilops tauschii TaxID=37682 RepID=M8BHF9_AEGTA
MDNDEEHGGNGEERVPRSPTPASSMGSVDGKKGAKEMLKRQGEADAMKKINDLMRSRNEVTNSRGWDDAHLRGGKWDRAHTEDVWFACAGVSTPGGFWPGSQDSDHLAGDPMLRVQHPSRFMVFFYSNTTAFVASLVVVMLLMSNTVTQHGFRSCALWVCTGAAMVGLMGAFASGSCRSLKTSMYVVALVAAVLLYIAIQALVFLCEPVKNLIHDWQQALDRYLNKFERLDLEQQNQQQSRASEHGNDDAYQILRKSRMYLLLLGILAASVTYQAGLNPPGGFWQGDAAADSRHHYLAGDPILHITYPRRYLAFFYCNATAFVASLVILILLLSNILSTQGIKYCALQVAMILDLFGLIGAYAAGSCRQVSKSVYVSLLVVPVFLYVGIHVVVFMLEVWPARPAWIQALSEKMEQCAPSWLKELFEHPEQGEEEAADVERTLEKRRKLLLLLAILAASLTYQAGMGPPGGFWQESKLGHVAGDPVLNDNYPRRYVAFFYCNATAFVASLAVIMLLVNRKLSAREIRSHALRVCVILDLVGLMGAFAAGSCRKVSTSIYVLVLTFAVLLCIALQVTLVLSEPLRGLAGRGPDLVYAAMSPPGGLWGDTTGHTAGDPVLTSNYPRRYKAFFYCNATSFMASLVIMVLLLIKRVSDTPPALLALHAAMILDLFGLMGAYAAGSCRRVRTSAYILALVVGVSAYIAVLVVASIGIAGRLRSAMDWLTEQVTRKKHIFAQLKKHGFQKKPFYARPPNSLWQRGDFCNGLNILFNFTNLPGDALILPACDCRSALSPSLPSPPAQYHEEIWIKKVEDANTVFCFLCN